MIKFLTGLSIGVIIAAIAAKAIRIDASEYKTKVNTELDKAKSINELNYNVISDINVIMDSLITEIRYLTPDSIEYPEYYWRYTSNVQHDINLELVWQISELKADREFFKRECENEMMKYRQLMIAYNNDYGCKEIYDICNKGIRFWRDKYNEIDDENYSLKGDIKMLKLSCN